MTAILDDVWGIDDPDACQLTSLTDYLLEEGLLRLGLPDDLDDDARPRDVVNALSGRDSDRIRILDFLAHHPDGTSVPHITAYVCKGVRPDRVDIAWSSDPDYRFVSRYIDDLETRDFVDVDTSTTPNRISTTTELLDLISIGKRETQHLDDSLVYGRDWTRNILRTTNELTESQKHHAAKSLHRYVDRIDDYKLLFELEASDGFRSESSTWTKDYKTRFNDKGRTGRSWARLQGALDYGRQSNTQNAVLVTLTVDPGTLDDPTRPDPRTIYDLAADPENGINPAFHRLTQWLKRDPSCARDTRRDGVPAWDESRDPDRFHYFTGSPVPADGGADPTGPVTGRPRRRLDYVKVLEWTERGLPHLHVLFFDVPTRDSDGMPWLCDKRELSHRWQQLGMGQIVDTYPLTYREDLDELGDYGTRVARDEDGSAIRDDDGDLVEEPVSEGFVCWYKHGCHGHDDEWVEERTRYDYSSGDRINEMQSTAGAYLGKYLSAMYEEMFRECDSLEEREMHSKAAWWKLALYWATGRQIWSISENIRAHLEDGDDVDVRRGVVDVTQTSLDLHTDRALGPYRDLEPVESTALAHIAKRAINNRDDVDRSPGDVVGIKINHLGTYHYADLPDPASIGRNLDREILRVVHDPNEPHRLVRGDRPPPTADVWS